MSRTSIAMDKTSPARRSSSSLCIVSMVVIIMTLFGGGNILVGQDPNSQIDAMQAADRWLNANRTEMLNEFRMLLEYPNVSRDQEDVRRVADHILSMLEQRGIEGELLESSGANPVVYAEINSPDAERTIVVYAHYDGQPVNAARWVTTSPFTPRMYSNAIEAGGVPIDWPSANDPIDDEARIYARSVSDDKLPILSLLTAIDALDAAGIRRTSNLKLFLDGEEEIGSPNMQTFLARFSDRFSDADLWLFLDGPLHQSRKPTVYFGVRGVCSMEITVYGATRNLHSGHYGNWAPNPALRLSQLLAGMKDDNDQVSIPGFYESVEPLTATELAAIRSVPSVDQRLRDELGLVETENNNQPYLERMQLPSLNIRGLSSATVGDSSRNIVPNAATASLDIRLVRGNDPLEMLELVERYIRDQGYHIVREDPSIEVRRSHALIAKITNSRGYPAAKTSMDQEEIQPILNAMEAAADGESLLKIPSLGGSLPLYLITDQLEKPLVIVPFANHDNNQHAPDENLRMGNLFDSVRHLAAILSVDESGTVGQSVRSLEFAAITPIPRRLPPEGNSLSNEQRMELSRRLDRVTESCSVIEESEFYPNVGVYLKAVRFALDHNEFYRDADFEWAFDLLDLAEQRKRSILTNQYGWQSESGLVVQGYRSSIDGSLQPFGLDIPAELDLTRTVPMYVWLHGRGDQVTDIHFIRERLQRSGAIHPDNAVVLHPFGRHCVGFKSAGEIDVLEAIEAVCERFPIDRERIVLMGFSMGGAGAWHLGAHYPHLWASVGPGAGFAETREYNRITRANLPPEYTQTLWGMYDVPRYVRNLFNMPVVAYSGENDRQIQAARVMEEAFELESMSLTHLIGPGMGHQYHPDTLAEIMDQMDDAIDPADSDANDYSYLQTQTLRYHRAPGIEVSGLGEHWQDSRVTVDWTRGSSIVVSTENVTQMQIDWENRTAPTALLIDQQLIELEPEQTQSGRLELTRARAGWSLGGHVDDAGLQKLHGLQGPIDDAFLSSFVHVLPSHGCANPRIERWVRFESEHQIDRWRALFRGDPRVINDREITGDIIANHHLILWGDPSANEVLGAIINDLPISWTNTDLSVNGETYDAAFSLPVMIYPNPMNPSKYIVINSGPTFRERNDRTNSLQNPQLPDWAVVDVRQDPDGDRPGLIVGADFFDEQWQFKVRDGDRSED